MKRISTKITNDVLSLDSCYKFVQAPECGAISLFVGTVRNLTKGKTVHQLDFSSYRTMALKEINKIAQKALESHPIHKIAIHHAEGILKVGDIPVIIAVSSAHRTAAFDACQFAIDTLKKTVPIWKKEHFDDGEIWVSPQP
ncbi:MAG: molybdenum cofactor biosynthesis protein MoaE [Flavobacteriaceae bacterium]|nr:MAG: molybdenum cofactor biosynthesis protein MoaE [Flavobacteriaceae bacterium]